MWHSHYKKPHYALHHTTYLSVRLSRGCLYLENDKSTLTAMSVSRITVFYKVKRSGSEGQHV